MLARYVDFHPDPVSDRSKNLIAVTHDSLCEQICAFSSGSPLLSPTDNGLAIGTPLPLRSTIGKDFREPLLVGFLVPELKFATDR